MGLVLNASSSQPCPNDDLLAGLHQTPQQPPPQVGPQNKPHPLPYSSVLGSLPPHGLWPFKIKKPSPLPSTDRSACFAELPKTLRPRLSRLDRFNFRSQLQIYFFNYTTSQPLHSALQVFCIALRPTVSGRVLTLHEFELLVLVRH